MFILNLLEYGIIDSSRIYFASFDDDPEFGRIEGKVIGGSKFQDEVERQIEKYKDKN